MSVFTENWGSHAIINPFSQLPEMKEPQMSVKFKEAKNFKKVDRRVSLLKLPQASKNDVLDAIHKDLQTQSPSFPALSKVIAVNPFPLKSKNNKVSAKDRSPKFFRAKEVGRIRTSSEKPL